jgi:hypothetical protein
MSIVNVRHVSKNVIRVEPEDGYNVVVFGGAKPEIMVSSDSGEDTVRVRLVPPGAGQTISFVAREGRVVEVIYTDKVDGY